MNEKRINTLFLTKDDCSWASSLKQDMMKMNCEVYYVNSFKEMVNKILYLKSCIIFINERGKEILHSLAPMLDSNLMIACNVIYIGDTFDDVQAYTKYSNFYICTTDQVKGSMPKFINMYRLTTAMHANVLNKDKLNDVLNYHLTKLGFTPKWLGYKFIKDCLDICVTNDFAIGSLIADVYPVVGLKNNTSPNNVERSIRNAITKAYEDTKFEVPGFEEFHNTTHKITNRWFLATLLDKLKTMESLRVSPVVA